MAKTSVGTAHRHKTKSGYWSDKTDTDSGSTHSHVIDLASFTEADVKQLLVIGGHTHGGTTPPSPPADTTPPVASTPSVTAITQTSVQVSWTTNEPATGQVEYGTTVSYGSTTTLDSSFTTSKSQTVSGLTAGTLYHYRIKASDAVPNAGNSIDRTFTTTAAAPSPPAAPTGLTATPGNTTVTLNWSAIPGCTYKVYKNAVFLANSSSPSYVATGLTNGVQVSFTVSAVNGGGEGAQSAAVTATPTSPPTDTTPPVVSNPVHSAISQTEAQIDWTVNEPATGQVEYGPTTSYGSTSTLEPGYLTAHSQTLSGLTASTLYHYRAKSVDAAGNIGYSIDRTFTTATPPAPTLPPAPTGLTAVPGDRAVQLNWTAISGCTYKVYRNASGGAYSLIASPSSPSRYDTGLVNGTLYGYKVSAVNGAGEGPQSAAVSATPSAPSSLYPTPRTLVYVAPPAPPAIPTYLLTTGAAQTQWGTRMTRVSNTAGIRNIYATSPGWNFNGTKILLGATTGPAVIIDGVTYAEIRRPPFLVGNTHWAFTNADLLYGTWDGDPNLYSQNVVTDALVSVHNFSGLTDVSLGSSEGHMSADDRYFPLLTRAGSTEGILVYDRTTDTIVAQRTLGVRPDLCQMSPLGNYVIINWNIDAAGSEKGVWLYSRALAPIRQLTATGGNHGDVGLDINGNEVYVYIDGAITSYNLANGTATQVLPSPTAFSLGHVSCRNFTRPGYVYCSMYDYPASGTRPGKDVIVAAPISGAGAPVEHFGWSYHRNDGTTGSNYDTNPFAVPSPDGTKVLMGSEFGGASTYAYVLEV